MKYLSVCSGIEAATVAWHDLGFNPVGFSEIEKFPASVLNHHYPEVTNFGDMTKFKEWNLEPNDVDLLVGGTPCQSFSVAGLRKGLDDPRGNLALVYCAMLEHFRPKWFVWENVPGVLSSSGGRDFGSFLGAVAELGYGFSYRVLDAQYFGVAQRRRRVFVVGHLGSWEPAAAVLFERESLRRDTAPSREAGKETSRVVAPSLTASNDPSRSPQSSEVTQQVAAVHAARMVAFGEYVEDGTASAMKARDYKDATDLVSYGFDLSQKAEGIGFREEVSTTICGLKHPGHGNHVLQPSYGIPGNWIGCKPENGGNAVEPMHDVAPCLTKTDRHGVAQPMPINTMIALRHEALGERTGFGIGDAGDPAYTLTKGHSHAVAHPIGCFKGGQGSGAGGIGYSEHVAPTLPSSDGGNRTPTLMTGMAVRRLTPVECERLQGFPDNYTNIPWRNKEESPDGPRYKALGNSMAVPVMRWIGERIKMVDELC